MRVRINGDFDVVPASEVRYALEWYGHRLLGEQANDVRLDVHFVDKLGKDAARMRQVDLNSFTDFRIDFNVRKLHTPRAFYITTAHESVHVWQYATRCWARPNEGKTWWRGVMIDEDEFTYHQLPWEIEARRMERPLYEEFLNHLRERAKASHILTRRHVRAARTVEVLESAGDWMSVVLKRDEAVVMVVPAKRHQVDAIAAEWRRRGRLKFTSDTV